MLTVKCYQPDEPRVSDDICHWTCLQLEAYRTQKEMLSLQHAIRDQLVLTIDALRQLQKVLIGLTDSLAARGGALTGTP